MPFHGHTRLITPHQPLTDNTHRVFPLYFLQLMRHLHRSDSLLINPYEYDLVLYDSTVYKDLIDTSQFQIIRTFI